MRYEVRWEDGIETKSSTHDSEKGAKAKAREMSGKDKFRLAIVAEIDEAAGVIMRKWTYENGKQTDSHNDETTEVVEETDKAEVESEGNNAEPIETEAETETENKPETKPKNKKATKSKAKPKADKKAKVEETEAEAVTEINKDETEMAMTDKAAKFYDQFDFRKDSSKGKFTRALLSNMGKPLTLSQIGRATFGSDWSEKKKGKLSSTAAMVKARMKREKITSLELVVEKNDKGDPTYAIKSK